MRPLVLLALSLLGCSKTLDVRARILSACGAGALLTGIVESAPFQKMRTQATVTAAN